VGIPDLLLPHPVLAPSVEARWPSLVHIAGLVKPLALSMLEVPHADSRLGFCWVGEVVMLKA
jgi:hypothetical protein